eukprot:172211-Amphidinium_carterae.1
MHDQDTKPLSSALWSCTSCQVATTGRQAWHEPFNAKCVRCRISVPSLILIQAAPSCSSSPTGS